MSEVMIGAILKTGLQVPSLAKGEHNKHGGFNYVGIDRFYEQVARVAMHNGLTWKAREVDARIVEVYGGKDREGNAKLSSAMLATYEFDIMHVSGEMMSAAFRITIVHPLQGAQTAGSAMSYAEKQFMREVFKVVTGEPDADATDSRVFEAGDGFGGFEQAPPPQAVATINGGVTTVAEDAGVYPAEELEKLMVGFLPLAKTEKQLNDYWLKNAEQLKVAEQENKPVYDRMVAAFKARKAEIKSKKG